MNPITWNDFEKVDMRVGTIISAEVFTKAKKPAYIVQIDFGEFGIKNSSAQITKLYKPEDLIGKQVIAVLNFPPKQIGPFISNCLVMGAIDLEGGVSLLTPSLKCENGLRIG